MDDLLKFHSVFMIPDQEPFAGLSSYASLQLLHQRFLLCGKDAHHMEENARNLPPLEKNEFDKFKFSPFGKKDEFQKYCALRQAEVLGIPRPQIVGRCLDGTPARTCGECVSQKDSSGRECRRCLAVLDAFLAEGCKQSECEAAECSLKRPGQSFNTCTHARSSVSSV